MQLAAIVACFAQTVPLDPACAQRFEEPKRVAGVPNVDAPDGSVTIEVDLKLQTGGRIVGLVVDHTPGALVVVHNTTPYVFAWTEIETGSAFAAKRNLMALSRGGRDHLTAQDHYDLGLFALSGGRGDLASAEFRTACRIDSNFGQLTNDAMKAHRRQERVAEDDVFPLDPVAECDEPAGETHGLARRIESALVEVGSTAVGVPLSEEVRAKILKVYDTFGEDARRSIDRRMVRIETDHFVIWTDWGSHDRKKLGAWCERMYTELCGEFGLNARESVFLAKCPVFCFASPAKYQRFARRFDGYDATGTVGYTRSIQKNGHVHLVLLRRGRRPEDFLRFSDTLVHEGTHAFVHRLYSNILIPHWVNEGLAELMAERVLAGHGHAGEKATLLAQQYVRYDWPIAGMLRRQGPIGVHEYALAHSVVAYLERIGGDRFAGFIKGLKQGMPLNTALQRSFDGLTTKELEAHWREDVRLTDSLLSK